MLRYGGFAAGFRRRIGRRYSGRGADARLGRMWPGPAAPGRRLEVVLTTLFRRLGRPVSGRAAAAALTLGLVAVGLQFSSPASAQSSSCADPVTSAPTGPATVSAASTPFGRVLVVGSGA